MGCGTLSQPAAERALELWYSLRGGSASVRLSEFAYDHVDRASAH